MQENIRIEKLVPPEINPNTILKLVDCTRPLRKDRFNISMETTDSRLLVHCYGHGGSGWTTVFGSVQKALRLFSASSVSQPSPSICVVGAGCIGLTMAVELALLGYSVRIVAKDLYDLPSWRAAGYFALVSVDTSEEDQEDLDRMGIETFQTLQAIEKGTHPYITSETLSFMPVYCGKEMVSGVEELEKRGLIPKKEEVILDFNGVLQHGYYKYMTYFMNTTMIMQQLHDSVKKLGIKVDVREVNSFDELEEEVVFNCSGMGSSRLTNDSSLVPVRGHLVLLRPSAGAKHMEYMIFSKFPYKGKVESIYLFPKTKHVDAEHIDGTLCRGVLGGSYLHHAESLPEKELEELDAREFTRIIDQNCLFFYGMSYEKRCTEKSFVQLGILQDLFPSLSHSDPLPKLRWQAP